MYNSYVRIRRTDSPVSWRFAALAILVFSVAGWILVVRLGSIIVGTIGHLIGV